MYRLIIRGYMGYNMRYKIKLDLKRLSNLCFFAIETNRKQGAFKESD